MSNVQEHALEPINLYRIDLKEAGVPLVEVGNIVITETVFKLTKYPPEGVGAGDRLAHVTIESLPGLPSGELISLDTARDLMKKKVGRVTLRTWAKSKKIGPKIGATLVDGTWVVDRTLFLAYSAEFAKRTSGRPRKGKSVKKPTSSARSKSTKVRKPRASKASRRRVHR
jgi:hypothetical protein